MVFNRCKELQFGRVVGPTTFAHQLFGVDVALCQRVVHKLNTFDCATPALFLRGYPSSLVCATPALISLRCPSLGKNRTCVPHEGLRSLSNDKTDNGAGCPCTCHSFAASLLRSGPPCNKLIYEASCRLEADRYLIVARNSMFGRVVGVSAPGGRNTSSTFASQFLS